jgi:mannose-6-phosphate isomerase-like protein (cupin superfamily)
MATVFDDFVVFTPALGMEPLPAGPDVYQRLNQLYSDFESHSLIAAHQFTQDWPTWEIHPKGDEMVVLLSGSATFVLQTESGQESHRLTNAGEFLIVPRNTWHTARIAEACSLLFVTPGEGTLNETQPPAG